MGTVCGKSSSDTITRTAANSQNTNNNARANNMHSMIGQDLASHLSIDHALNINHKFSEFFKILGDKTVGDGMKRTYGYISHLRKEDLIRKREEFWDTRTEGALEIWQTIRTALYESDDNANAILQATGLHLVKNSIQIVYDDHGKKYEIPVFCINEPSVYEIKETDASKPGPINFEKAKIKVRIRCTRVDKDVEYELDNTTLIQDLKAMYLGQAKIDEKQFDLVKTNMFYKGTELKENHYIGDYALEPDNMLTFFVRKIVV